MSADQGIVPASEQDKFDWFVNWFLDRGWTRVDSHGDLAVGTRVCHVGEQRYEARSLGTGNVAAVFTKDRGHETWVETVTLKDKPLFEGMSRLSQLANYHVRVVNQ